MPVDGWNAVLVLGGIRSGKSEFAESLVSDAPGVCYVATAAAPPVADPEWAARLAAHRARRPADWATVETGTDPTRLVKALVEAGPDDTLLVDDLGGWVAAGLPRGALAGSPDDAGNPPADVAAPGDGFATDAAVAELAAAVRACRGRLVLVSSEVGLSLVPPNPVGRAFADALGRLNRAVADACDAVVLVVAGQPSWLKPTAPEVVAAAVRDRAAAPGGAAPAPRRPAAAPNAERRHPGRCRAATRAIGLTAPAATGVGPGRRGGRGRRSGPARRGPAGRRRAGGR